MKTTHPKAWSRVFGGAFGIVSGVFAVYGTAVIVLGAPGHFGHGIDRIAGIFGLLGVLITCIDMVRVNRALSQRAEQPALVTGFPGLLGMLLAAAAVIASVFLGIMALVPVAGTLLRGCFAAFALYLLAIAFWLKRESRP
jgi:hypothetical protein